MVKYANNAYCAGLRMRAVSSADASASAIANTRAADSDSESLKTVAAPRIRERSSIRAVRSVWAATPDKLRDGPAPMRLVLPLRWQRKGLSAHLLDEVRNAPNLPGGVAGDDRAW